jgi:hypothetical protein
MGRLRTQFLTRPASEFGFAPTPEFPRVYGILMEWPINDVIATLVGCGDGNASLYTTSTFGIIGGIAHESVRIQASAWVKLASDHVDDARAALEFPYPKSDRIRFYFLTFEGVRVIEADLKAVSEGIDDCSALFHQGQAVLTELRLIHEQGSEEDGLPEKPRKEWSGPPGYVNCLLTLMSEGVVRSLTIKSSEPVPDLVRLAAGNEEKREWIETQEFDFPSLDVKAVIDVLKKTARIEGMPFLTRRHAIPTLHARNDGRAVARVFDVTVGPFDKTVRIELAPDGDPRVAALQRDADARK